MTELDLSKGCPCEQCDKDRARSSAGIGQAPVDITGWKLVPDDPTEAMWQAGRSADIHPGDSYSKVWRAMLEAAPDVEDCETANSLAQPDDGYRAAWLELIEVCNNLKRENFELRNGAAQSSADMPPRYLNGTRIRDDSEEVMMECCSAGSASAAATPSDTEARGQSHRDAISPSGGQLFNGAAQPSAGNEDDRELVETLSHRAIDYTLDQLCRFLGVNPADVTWDASTETVDGDVQAVIGNILRAKFGEDWGPNDAAKPSAVSADDLDPGTIAINLRGLESRMQHRVEAIEVRDGKGAGAIQGKGVGIGYLLAKDLVEALGEAATFVERSSAPAQPSAGIAAPSDVSEDELTEFLCDEQDRIGPGCDERALAFTLLRSYAIKARDDAAQPSAGGSREELQGIMDRANGVAQGVPDRAAIIEECARVAESYPSSGEQTEHPVEYWIRRLSISSTDRGSK